MRCENCGADFDKTLLNCPYCDAENLEVAEKNYKEKISDIDRTRKEIIDWPTRVWHEIRKYSRQIFILMIMLIFLIIIGSYFISNLKEKKAIADEKKHSAQLELMLQERDFEGIYLYIKKIPHTYVSYAKYDEIYNLYSSYDILELYLEMIESFEESSLPNELKVYNYQEAIRSFLKFYIEKNVLISDKKRLGNEVYIKEFYEQVKIRFMEVTEIDESILDEILIVGDSSEDSTEDALRIAKKLVER